MDKEEIIEAIADMIIGLQVPVSIGRQYVGKAYEPWEKLKQELHGFGWIDRGMLIGALTEKLS